MDQTAATPTAPSISEVVQTLADEVVELDGVVDRITIERATDHEYMVRIYAVDEEDYLPVQLTYYDRL